MPHLNFSHPQMRAVLQFAEACGATNVPLLEALNKMQEQLKSLIGNPMTQHIVPSGTVYYINMIAESIKKDMSNPHI
ncbi:hypothetical protein OPQ81_005071 [Rhizoctonia solani]|nr:hypothetical protein OPQ81_005071 [Rhizoctonia solani]